MESADSPESRQNHPLGLFNHRKGGGCQVPVGSNFVIKTVRRRQACDLRTDALPLHPQAKGKRQKEKAKGVLSFVIHTKKG